MYESTYINARRPRHIMGAVFSTAPSATLVAAPAYELSASLIAPLLETRAICPDKDLHPKLVWASTTELKAWLISHFSEALVAAGVFVADVKAPWTWNIAVAVNVPGAAETSCRKIDVERAPFTETFQLYSKPSEEETIGKSLRVILTPLGGNLGVAPAFLVFCSRHSCLMT